MCSCFLKLYFIKFNTSNEWYAYMPRFWGIELKDNFFFCSHLNLFSYYVHLLFHEFSFMYFFIIYIITIRLLFLLHANFIYKRKIKSFIFCQCLLRLKIYNNKKKDEKRINKKSTNLIKRILVIVAFDLIKNYKWQIVTGCYCWGKKVILMFGSNLILWTSNKTKIWKLTLFAKQYN